MAKKKTKAKKKRTPVKRKMGSFDHSFSSVFRPKIRVIGIGGGGGSIVSEIGRSLEKASFVIADTDFRAIKRKSGIKYFYFGEEVTHGLGTGMNPELGREAAEKERERISKLFDGQDIVILVASLGGGLGSGAAPVFAEIGRGLGNVILGVFTLPFKFEGAKKSSITHRSIDKLREGLNALITISNERIFKIVDEKTPITEAFSLVNKNLIESLESLIDMIYNPGVINIDFADVKTILKGRGMMAFLNTAEAFGKNRAEELSEKIMNNPLLNSNIKAEKMLFNISASDSLSMVEVDKISRKISELNPQARIIFGISKNLKSKSKVKVTLLIAGPSFEPPLAQKVVVKEVKTHKRVKRKSAPVIKTAIPIIVPVSSEVQAVKKDMIRRNAMEVKKAEEIEEDKRLKQEEEWEIPAFLRKMRHKA
ncbi:cell division FtsZ family protein [Patescibacteria group bacterium]|nr:cell division FtsZ family protein [Patescibacteria group bacterium]